MENDRFWIALALTTLAGLSTGIGSAIAFFAKRTNTKFLSISLGFSAGMMVYVCLTDILVTARLDLISYFGAVAGSGLAAGAFFGGVFFAALIDKLVPDYENPHELHKIEEMAAGGKVVQIGKMRRLGLFTAVALTIHNFPEGMATFVAGLKGGAVGVSIAVAIAIHNIPEGISVSVPIFYATGSRRKAFIYSFLTGFCEPAGALLGYFLFLRFLTDAVFGFVFGAIAGIMVFISFDELLPAAHEYGEHHHVIYGLLGGMAVMAASLVFLG
jgi:ZIP family zinc transporter